MTDGEILRSYKTAKNPAAQIKVLAELNSCKPAEIVNVLISQGVDISAPSAKKPKKPSQFTDKLQALYDQGLSDKAMAADAGCSPATVARYRKINKLPPNDPAGGDENKVGNVLPCEDENKVGTVRRNEFVPIPSFNDIEDYNRQLLQKSREDEAIHYKKSRTVADLFEEDRRALKPLPSYPFNVCRFAY